MYRVIVLGVELWVAFNLMIAVVITYRRSPYFRHQIFRWSSGAFTLGEERQSSHVLVAAARDHR